MTKHRHVPEPTPRATTERRGRAICDRCGKPIVFSKGGPNQASYWRVVK